MRELRKNNPFTIVGIGEILWDIYPEARCLGGAPANFAIHVQQLGNHGIVVSRVGSDELGRGILLELERRNLDIRYIQIDGSKKTGTVRVHLDDRGIPSFECSQDVAFDYLEFTDDLKCLAMQTDAVLFGTLAQRTLVSRKTIQTFLEHATQAFKMYDINLRGWNSEVEKVVQSSLQLADALKLNDDELHILKQAFDQLNENDLDFLQILLEKYWLKLIALTLGEKGCFLLTNEKESFYSPGISIAPVDTTGCGDAFAAALVTRYMRGSSLKEMADFSNAVGAYIATRRGAVPTYSEKDLRQQHLVSS